MTRRGVARHRGLRLQVAATHSACEVLGPGTRFVVWVQGCPLRCPGCISPQWLPFDGGEPRVVEDLASEIVATPGVDGLTFSGGEPFAQAEALVALVAAVRAHRDLSVMSYTGFTMEHIRRHGDGWQRRLVEACDIVVDGPYVAARHASLRWRASANQRLHFLGPRHQELASRPDQSAGIQFELDPANGLLWTGVPEAPGFPDMFEAALRRAGVVAGGDQ
jgi:anaerobic ribonucleoside-triphosphate reductase activating protein